MKHTLRLLSGGNLLAAAALAVVLLALPMSVLNASPIVDSLNQTALPDSWSSWWADHVAWEYTPSFDYNLDGVLTMFRTGDGRDVTVAVYDGIPYAAGVTLLRSAIFVPVAYTFTGGTFSPLSLEAGHSYYIGFENISGLGSNANSDPGVTQAAIVYGWGGYTYGPGLGGTGPIVEFTGAGVPDGGPSIMLLGGVLVAIGCLRRRILS